MGSRFKRFLESRGVKKIIKPIETFGTPESNEEIFDFLSLERIGDSDLFYTERRESFNTETILDTDLPRFRNGISAVIDDTIDDNDDDESVLIIDERAEEEYVTGPQKPLQSPDHTLHSLSTMLPVPLNNAEDPNYVMLNVNHIDMLTQTSPATKFVDSLQLKYLGNDKFQNHESVRRYKNNLSEVITSSSGRDYFITVSNSELMIYEFGINQIPLPAPVLKFDTKPIFTTTTDRLISTWPYFPHTINYLKVSHWLGRQVLGVCCDDGTLMIYFIDYLVECIEKYSTSRGLKIHPEFKLKLDSSLWGVDFLSYDFEDTEHHLVLASDNSQKLTLFYFHNQDNKFYHVKTHQILHNIPDCSFLSYKVKDSIHAIRASCVSISGELLIFQFKFKLIHGPLHESSIPNDHESAYYIDPSIQQLESNIEIEPNRFKRVQFSLPVVTNRTLLNEDCWTSRPIKRSYFKSVSSLGQVFGDDSFNDQMSRIIAESLLFGEVDDSFGICKDWQYFQTPVLNFEDMDFEKLTTMDDDYRRLNKMYINPPNDDEDDVLIVSTAKKLGLFNVSLFCQCSTPAVFNITIPNNEETKFSNRISITQLIPKLSAVLAVSQQGLISVFRLCEYRGILGMRQEYLFPNAIALALGSSGYRTIEGISIRDYSPNPHLVRYLIYVIYTDGLILTYQLSRESTISMGDVSI